MELPENELGPWNIERAVRNIRKGDPDPAAARGMLRLFCTRAKELHFPEWPFPEEYLALLVSAFERYLSGEELDIAKSLGLKRRGRPGSPEIQQRNVYIAAEVLRLEIQGRPVTDNADGEGAIADVAERHGLSASQVRDIYYEYLNDGMAQLVLERRRKKDSA